MNFERYSKISFDEANTIALTFARNIRKNLARIKKTLLRYESTEVVDDEVERSLDLMESLKENEKYFQFRVGEVAAFLPRNQPLYALCCFVLVPSLMASKVKFRIPHSMKDFFPELLEELAVNKYFPNVFVVNSPRAEYLLEIAQMYIDPDTHKSCPVTDVVIFTGVPHHAEKLRLIFDRRTLFILNGAGHNPVVVGDGADLQKAVEAVIKLQFYNQGQDCAAPNAILVNEVVYKDFLEILRRKMNKLSLGSVNDPEDLPRIMRIIADNYNYLDSKVNETTNIRECVVGPFLISKPLVKGGNFTELFAPIVYIQKYGKDAELALYFEDTQYARNAMYVTLYGKSRYVMSLTSLKVSGRKIHEKESILINKHLHMKGVERGTQPYGGSGYAASTIFINDEVISKATLPQRDIYEWVVVPLVENKSELTNRKKVLKAGRVVVKQNRQIDHAEGSPVEFESAYIDKLEVECSVNRYVEYPVSKMLLLLDKPNRGFFESLDKTDQEEIRKVGKMLALVNDAKSQDISDNLYEMVKKSGNKKLFGQLYMLLFGRSFGPKLGEFLEGANRVEVIRLLDM